MISTYATILIAVISAGFVSCDLDAVPDILNGDPADCSCAYHRGGCVISVAAPIGFKCKCIYRGAWTCSGSAFPCVGEEICPGNLADYCACKLGDGDCGGYRNPASICEEFSRRRIGVEGMASCNCEYHRGGCIIKKAAPFGWKCVCTHKGFWTCRGWAQQCAANEVCLGDDHSYCGCQQGDGNCGGYPEKPNCPSPFVSTTCDCDRSSDWNKGLYAIEGVSYDSDNLRTKDLQPVALAVKEIPNNSSINQSIDLQVSESISQTSSFSRTGGIDIEAGTHFKVGIPLLAEGKASFSISESIAHTSGISETRETEFEASFTCTGAPRKITRCEVIVLKAKVSVPYTMTVKHKVIPNCACESYGVWMGSQAYNSKLVARDMGNCTDENCI